MSDTFDKPEEPIKKTILEKILEVVKEVDLNDCDGPFDFVDTDGTDNTNSQNNSQNNSKVNHFGQDTHDPLSLLNALSEIRYPTHMLQTQRLIEHAYLMFIDAHNRTQPSSLLSFDRNLCRAMQCEPHKINQYLAQIIPSESNTPTVTQPINLN